MTTNRNDNSTRGNGASGTAADTSADSTPTTQPGNGGGGKRTSKPPVASASPKPRRGGYKTPPTDKQFKPGQSGNPSGRRKKPKLPHHVGQQIEAVTVAFIGELNQIMIHGIPKKPPTGAYAGAKLFARMFFRDATTKDGYARKRLYALYHEDRQYLDIFQPYDTRAQQAEELINMLRAVVDPTVTEEECKQVFEEISTRRQEQDDLP